MKDGKKLPSPIFLGGAPALDFLNSIATPTDEIVEWIGNGAHFLSWMKQAGLLTDNDLKIIKKNMPGQQLDAAAKQARALRDWFRRFVNGHKGNTLKKRAFDQVGPLNRLMGADAVFWRIQLSEAVPEKNQKKGVAPSNFDLRLQRHWSKADSLVSLLAEEIARFICTADFRHVKACEGGKCTLLFLDQSRRHGRRWCSMAICGNRAKSVTFAARSKDAHKEAKLPRKLRRK